MEKVLFIFRRDLRLSDNTGLNFALKNAKKVVPCFIFTPEQIEKNPYLGKRSLQFMIESLEDLGEEIRKKGGSLYFFYGMPENIVEKCIKELNINGVIVNRDYTPYSIARDKNITTVCKTYGIPFYSFDDALLHPPEATLKSDGKPYTVFTPFYNNASQKPVPPTINSRTYHFENGSIPFAHNEKIFEKILPERLTQAKGGRTEALKILKDLKRYKRYSEERDYPAIEGTTHLSAHLKLTTCSPREVYDAIKDSIGRHSPLIRSLHWRDFFASIALYFPYVFGHAFHKKYDQLKWSDDTKSFERWCAGKTGFPIVDAGMRELNQTGYMHNRVRMITASFLVKDMHINWLWGEKYFAQTLIDYDPVINNGNWQWAASTGCDAQPYFRIFNPWLQQTKFDPDCEYIKKWIPEIKQLPPHQIHLWHLEKNRVGINHYPAPMLDHSIESKKALEKYKQI
jgi:deoxyribodipyrimidine photo-lyase